MIFWSPLSHQEAHQKIDDLVPTGAPEAKQKRDDLVPTAGTIGSLEEGYAGPYF